MSISTLPGTAAVTIADLCDVLAWGWNGEELAERVFELRRQTIQGLPPQGLGDPQVFASLFYQHPDSWRLLVDQDRQVVGCWHFLSLQPEGLARALAGELCAQTITPAITRSLRTMGWHDIYVLSYILQAEWRYSMSSLRFARSMFEVLRQLAQQKVFVRELVANFATQEGLALARGLRLELVGQHSVRGGVYHRRLPELLTQLTYHDRRDAFVGQLRELYSLAEASG